MKFTAVFALAFISACACSQEFSDSQIAHEFVSSGGEFNICDVGEFSDGGTVSICVSFTSGELWLSHVENSNPSWSAAYESNGINRPISLADAQVVEVLSRWLRKNFKCENLESFSRSKTRVSSKNEIAAATLVSVLEPNTWSCPK